MKKKIILSIGAVAIAATMVFTTTLGLSNNAKMSALNLANIEALARGEYEDWVCVMVTPERCISEAGMDFTGKRTV